MVISPKDLENVLDIEKEIEEIDQRLIKSWRGRGVVVIYKDASILKDNLERIAKLYRAVGWGVKIVFKEQNPREAACWRMEFSKAQ